jgi:hypothetical protein
MRVFQSLLLFTLILCVSGCTPSLFSLFTEEDLVFEPELVGKWVENDTRLTFVRSANRYSLYWTEKNFTTKEFVSYEFQAHLVQLGSHRFLDFYPEELEFEDTFYGGHFLRLHTFYRFSLEGDTLRLVGLDPEWIEDIIDEGKIQINHVRDSHGKVLLTAPTKELQELVSKYADDPKAFNAEGPESTMLELQRST